MKQCLSAFLVALVINGLILANSFTINGVSAEDVPSLITTDTTWTKANSPYNLTGPLFIANGAKLTIEPGVTVDLGGYYIKVNGTLDARGTVTEKIIFSSYFTTQETNLGYTDES